MKGWKRKTGAVLSLCAVITFGGAMTVPAQADEIDNILNELGVLDEKIEAAQEKLDTYQELLPEAEKAFDEAKEKVVTAEEDVRQLTDRALLAESTLYEVTKEAEETKKNKDDSQKIIGQMAASAYKNAGINPEITLMVADGDIEQKAAGMSMMNMVMDDQAKKLDDATQQEVQAKVIEERQKLVKDEVDSLKAEAKTRLADAEKARAEAEKEKVELEELIAKVEASSAEILERRPEIRAKIEKSLEVASVSMQAIADKQDQILADYEKSLDEYEKAVKEWEKNGKKGKAPVKPKAPKTFVLDHPGFTGPLTSGFGWRPTPAGTIDFGGAGGYTHTGLDYGVACGTPVKAPLDGTVWQSGWGEGGAGNMVQINHGVSADKHTLVTNYYHLTKTAVSSGDKVKKGDTIAYVGTTGNSTGCHLHFETVLDGKAVDPVTLLPKADAKKD